MSWCYRVARVRYTDGTYYDMREWYNIEGHRPVWTVDAMSPMGEDYEGENGIDDLILELKRMLKAAKKARRHPELILDLKENSDADSDAR